MDIQYKAQNDAAVKVNRIRSKWTRDDVEDEDEGDVDLCCGLRREHIEAFVYWIFHCFLRRKSGRQDIKYTSYNPLRNEASSHSEVLESLNDDNFEIVRADKDHKPPSRWFKWPLFLGGR